MLYTRMRGWAPQNTVQLKCIMNDNNIDSSFSISFLMISKHFLIIFLITLIEENTVAVFYVAV